MAMDIEIRVLASSARGVATAHTPAADVPVADSG